MNSGDDDLRERILMAAISEFGRKGYDAASTNTIVNDAGVSKGLLFHYYSSKHNLFIECVMHVIESIRVFVLENMDFSDADMFSRLKQTIEIELNFCETSPDFMGMVNRLWYSESRADIEEHLPEQLKDYKSYFSEYLFKGVDMSRFKDILAPAVVVEYASLLMESSWLRFNNKHNNDFHEVIKHADEYRAELDTIFELIRYGAYKE